MPDFAYVALDTNGAEKSGTVRAPDVAAAAARLTAKAFYVLSLTERSDGQRAKSGLSFTRAKRMSAKELALFTRQMASLIGVSPLAETLRTLARQNEKPHLSAIIDNVNQGVTEGLPIADAMARQDRSFPALYRAMIAAGENSGSLPLIAERLAILLERQVVMRGKIIGALVYPIVLAVVAMTVVALLMITVVPRVVAQFDGVAQQLPLITRIVIGLSDFLANYWWAILVGLALSGLALWRGLKVAAFKYRFDAMLLRLPLLGKLLRNLHGARMARTLATMTASRLPVLEGMRLTTRTINNAVLRRAGDEMVEAIRAGGSLSGSMRAAGVFPPLLVYLAASGENAGHLDAMLERAADYLEREFDDFAATALTLLEPLIIVFMGGAVAVIILAILLPILQLQSLVGG
jgi:general secretion pathway protein F